LLALLAPDAVLRADAAAVALAASRARAGADAPQLAPETLGREAVAFEGARRPHKCQPSTANQAWFLPPAERLSLLIVDRTRIAALQLEIEA